MSCAPAGARWVRTNSDFTTLHPMSRARARARRSELETARRRRTLRRASARTMPRGDIRARARGRRGTLGNPSRDPRGAAREGLDVTAPHRDAKLSLCDRQCLDVARARLRHDRGPFFEELAPRERPHVDRRELGREGSQEVGSKGVEGRAEGRGLAPSRGNVEAYASSVDREANHAAGQWGGRGGEVSERASRGVWGVWGVLWLPSRAELCSRIEALSLLPLRLRLLTLVQSTPQRPYRNPAKPRKPRSRFPLLPTGPRFGGLFDCLDVE